VWPPSFLTVSRRTLPARRGRTFQSHRCRGRKERRRRKRGEEGKGKVYSPLYCVPSAAVNGPRPTQSSRSNPIATEKKRERGKKKKKGKSHVSNTSRPECDLLHTAARQLRCVERKEKREERRKRGSGSASPPVLLSPRL